MRPVVFLDRDGVINRKAPEGEYIRDWADFEFLPGAIEALRELRAIEGPALVVVSNQRGIARGHMSAEAVGSMHARMQATLAAEDAALDAVFVCPHEVGVCDCRKPALGMFLQAAREDPSIDLGRAVVVGDALSDLLAGHRLGARSYLVSSDPEPILAAAAAAGVTVAAHAPSLLELVHAGAFAHLAPVVQ